MPSAIPFGAVKKLINNIDKINRDPNRTIKSKPGKPASSSLQDIWDSLFYPGWGGLGGGGRRDPLDPLRAVIENAQHPERPVPKWAQKYIDQYNKPTSPPKPGDTNYISPKLRAQTDATIKAGEERNKMEAIHDPPPRFRLPPPPRQKFDDPYSVVHRLLKTEQATSMRYGQYHAWTTTAMKYGIPAPELIAAALATRTTAEPWAIESLAKRIQSGTRNAVVPYGTQSRGNLQEIVWEIDPHAAPVGTIYKAANAENYIPTYKTH